MNQKIKQDLSIGQNLRTLRQNCGLTQEQVVSKLQLLEINISREILSQIENGRYSVRVSILVALQSIYCATYNDFFAGLSLKQDPL